MFPHNFPNIRTSKNSIRIHIFNKYKHYILRYTPKDFENHQGYTTFAAKWKYLIIYCKADPHYRLL